MEKVFSNKELEKYVMKRFCNLLRNIVDRCIALSQYHFAALSQYRSIAGAQHMTIFVNVFSAKCDFAICVIAYWWFGVFQRKRSLMHVMRYI